MQASEGYRKKIHFSYGTTLAVYRSSVCRYTEALCWECRVLAMVIQRAEGTEGSRRELVAVVQPVAYTLCLTCKSYGGAWSCSPHLSTRMSLDLSHVKFF